MAGIDLEVDFERGESIHTENSYKFSVEDLRALAADAGFARMARIAGIEYSTLVRTICELGITRRREQQLVPDGWVLAQQLSGMSVAGPELELFSGGQR